ncbi:MAG: DUF4981 domain-containing protein, partial [Eubacterium sp.]|nr:DUF4981 domain-containing protein [Eubacterium sp.]
NYKKVIIKNKHLFTNTSEYDCAVMLYLDGVLIESGAIETDVEPLSEKEYELPFYGRETEICSDTGEYLIIVSFRMKYDTAWCERGHEVAFGQYSYFSEDIRYNNGSDPDDSLVGRHRNSIGRSIRFIDRLTAGSGSSEQKQREFSPLQIIKGHENIGVRGDDFSCLFSLNMGGLVSYEYKKKQLIGEIPSPNFWRAPTDNDRGAGYDRYYAPWKTGSLYREHRTDEYIKNGPEMKLNEDGTFDIVFRFFLMTSPIAIVNVSYKVYPDGMIRMGLDHDPKGVISQIAMLGLMAGYDEEETLHQMNEWSDEESIAGIRAVGALPDMPEFGFLLRLDADFDRIRWYGLGPDETYADRKRGGRLGIYENRVIDNMARYLRPQECGSKEDVRYIEVMDEKGDGLIFVSDGMCASALPYTPHEIENAMHAYELPPINHTIIRVALAQMGIGGDDSWGARVHPEYHIDMSEPLHFEVAFKGMPGRLPQVTD